MTVLDNDIHIYKTRKFSAFCVKNEFISNNLIESLVVDNAFVDIDTFVQIVKCNGFAILRIDSIISSETTFIATSAINRMVTYLTSHYDETEDIFDEIDMQAYEIVRLPRIGNGKHNVHFDPLFSKQHKVLQRLAAEASFDELLSKYMGKQCSLRETGISITRPMRIDHNSSCSSVASTSCIDPSQPLPHHCIPGEGMEWHSDGSRGEATVLMALEDVDSTMGSLHVVPGSHHEYKDGVGHEEVQPPTTTTTTTTTTTCFLSCFSVSINLYY